MHVDFWKRQFVFERNTMDAFKLLIAELAKNTQVVLRPHIAEDMKAWLALESDVGPGLRVVRDGSAIDWILASRVLVQNSCTTGIEALVMGHPTLSYAPFNNGILETFVGNRVIPPISGQRGIIESVEDLLARPRNEGNGEERREELAKLGAYVSNLDGSSTAAQWRRIKERFEPREDASERIFSMQQVALTNLPEWAEHKFDVSPEQIQSVFSMIARGLGKKINIGGKLLGKNLFAFRPT